MSQELEPQRCSQEVRSGKEAEGPEYPGLSAGQLEKMRGKFAKRDQTQGQTDVEQGVELWQRRPDQPQSQAVHHQLTVDNADHQHTQPGQSRSAKLGDDAEVE